MVQHILSKLGGIGWAPNPNQVSQWTKRSPNVLAMQASCLTLPNLDCEKMSVKPKYNNLSSHNAKIRTSFAMVAGLRAPKIHA